MSELRVSVILPTFERPELLARCLRALCHQSLEKKAYEILVADDAAERSSAERTRRLVERFDSPELRVRYIAVRGRHGPAAARNRALEEALGPVIAFTDDDTIPDWRWLEFGVRALEAHRNWVAVTGQTRVPIPVRPTDHELSESGLARAEFITANCFVRRSAMIILGGFDETFTMPWREDSDLHFRLIESAGEGAIHRERRAVVIHPVRPARFGVSLKKIRKASFNALLYRKHPDLYRERIQARPPLRYYAMVACLAAALIGGDRAVIALACWLLLVVEFSVRRLWRTSLRPQHVLEMFLTSMLLGPLAVFWRLYGAWRFRVVFV